MNNIQENIKITRDINIMIHSVNMTQLWKLRDMCHELEEEGFYKIHLILTKDLETVFRVSSFQRGGVDIIISTSSIEPGLWEALRNNICVNNPSARLIMVKKEHFICSHRDMDNNLFTENLKMKSWDDFTSRLQFCIRKMLEDKDLCIFS